MNQPNDLHDRLLDSALREVAGGHAPPNLSARILAAAENPLTPNEISLMERPKQSRRVWFALAVAACLLVGLGFLIPGIQRERETARRADAEEHLRQIAPAIQNHLDTKGTHTFADDMRELPPMPSSAEPTKQSSANELSVVLSQTVDPNTWQESEQDAPMLPEVAGKNQTTGAKYEFQQPPSAKLENDWRPKVQEPSRFASAGESGGQSSPNSRDRRILHAYMDPNVTGLDTVRLKYFRELNESARQWDELIPNRDAEGLGPGEPGDQYTRIYENPFIEARGEQAVSTFSIDVDTASYANVRQFIQSGQLPPPDAVRLEELINYFDYQYEPPAADSETPFSAAMEVASCPWEPKHRLVRIALQGRELENDKRPKSNLVFLIDVSGSMDEPNKLPLVVEGMKQLVRELGENDRVAIVVYASSEGLVLPSTPGTKQATILEALDRLQAGGSTAGGAGIQLAYQMAEDNFVTGGVNRVILCTDGDFNVGVTSTADLERMVEQKANDTKVFLSVLGFGRGNLNDAMMETISNRGNGNYHYVDNLTEARKVLVEEMTGTLVTIAKDVKIQVEFNPAQVAGYRLLGYENRMLRTEDFNDDKKDAGEIGAGHRVTALYEIVPAGEKVDVPPVDDLKYQQPAKPGETADSKELLTLKLRYKQPDSDTSTKIEFPMTDVGKAFSAATPDFKFATAVASFGMLLRDSEHKGNATYDAVLEIATEGAKYDPHGYRAEFLELVRKAKSL